MRTAALDHVVDPDAVDGRECHGVELGRPLSLEAGGETHRAKERVAERDLRRYRPAELRAVDEAEKAEHGPGERPERRLLEPAVDDERRRRAEHQAREHRTAAEKLHAVVDEARAAQLRHPDLRRRSARCSESAVDLELSPGGDVRDDREYHGRRMTLG